MSETLSSIYTSALTDGQLWIGNTNNEPTSANLTPGTGISIINAPGSINIAANGFGSVTWQTVNAGVTPMSKFTGYILQNAVGPSIFTISSVSGYNAVGDIYIINSWGVTGGFAITYVTQPIINYGNSVGTSLSTSNTSATVGLMCSSVGGSGFAFTVLFTAGSFTLS